MTTVVLDTHTLIWHLCKPASLGKEAKRLLRMVDQGKARGLIPAITVVELSLLSRNRRSVDPVAIEVFLRTNSAFELLPLDFAQTLEFALLTTIDDPFDRMVIAAARCSKAILLSADSTIQASGLATVVWD